MNDRLKYEFSWSLLGNLEEGRPNLGNLTRVEVYRLMQFTFRDIIEKRYGTAEADAVFFEAGMMSGKAFYAAVMGQPASLKDFCKRLQDVLRDFGIGILRFEQTDIAKGIITLTVGEDLDCSGLPELDYEVCTYDEGFIAGIFKCYFGEDFVVKEINCWCTGDRTCRFKAVAQRS